MKENKIADWRKDSRDKFAFNWIPKRTEQRIRLKGITEETVPEKRKYLNPESVKGFLDYRAEINGKKKGSKI